MALPKPLSQKPTGMPQMRRKSALRTASGSVQEQFLERVRAVAAEPALALPVAIGSEPAPIAKLRRRLESGALGFAARFDKEILGAIRVAQEIARQETAPVLLDARVDGNRRFFLARGHVRRLVHLGIQNWDDPLALMLAYGPLASKHGLWMFAGRELWSTGTAPTPPPEWWEDFAARTGLALAGDSDRSCPHADRPRLELRFSGGPALLACGPCGKRAGHLHGHLSQRVLRGSGPARPVELAVVLPDGRRPALLDALQALYRAGRLDEQGILEQSSRGGHGDAKFELAGHAYSDQGAFLAALDLADWEREPVRILTADGHRGATRNVADILAAHRERLPAAVAHILGGDDGFAARHPDVEARSLLRLAHDEATLRERSRGLPELTRLGPVGAWLDGLARDQRRLDRAAFLQRIRRDVATGAHPTHLFAVLVALGLDLEGERFLSHDAKEAGRSLAPLAKAMLEASGDAYAVALGEFLRESGTGETVA